MKKSISKKMTARVAILLAIMLMVLFFGSYRTVSNIVRNETEHYSKAITSIFADMVNHEASGMHLPINEGFSEVIDLYGDYICLWYRVDYTYTILPDTNNGTAKVCGFSYKEGKIEPHDIKAGSEIPFSFDEGLTRLFENDGYYIFENDNYERALDTVTAVTDEYGNRVFVGVGVSLGEIEGNIRARFFPVALILCFAFIALIVAMYVIIRVGVRRPAKQISDCMTAFIHDGKRSDIKLSQSSGDEFSMIATAFNRMSDDIDKYLESIDSFTREKERQKTELEIASRIQQGLLSPTHFETDDYKISAIMTPAKNIGGDLYDYMKLDGDRTLIVISDVSGKGLSASIFMAITLVLIRQYAKTDLSPAHILYHANNMLAGKNAEMLFSTAFVGIYNSSDNTFTYSNAGHNFPYVIGKELKILDGASGTLLGLFENEEYTEKTVTLSGNDTIFLYTDGLNESTDKDNRFFGTERLESALQGYRDSRESDLIEYINKIIHDFAKDAEQHDDITMLALSVKDAKHLTLDPDIKEFEKIKTLILSLPYPRRLLLDLCLAAEECFVNICSYAFEGEKIQDKKIDFTLTLTDTITVRFEDGGKKFDPVSNLTPPDDYDIDNDIGGLGNFIAFSYVDEVNYEYRDRKNILTLTKYLEEENNENHENRY